MARNVQLLLIENVDNTGIVGDVVNVRKGFARNFLLPRGLATTPSEAKVKELAGKRADAQKMLAELRKQREALITKLNGHELTLVRSCNDMGILYGAITQHEITVELDKAGFHGIKDREVRLGQPIKRIGEYEIHVKFEADLEAAVKLHIKPDRELNIGRADQPSEIAAAAAGADGPKLDENGQPILEKRAKDKSAKFDTAKPGAKKDEAPAAAAPEAKAEKKPKAEKADKPAKADKKK
jgi:large subunit ribosomal protein L9